MIINNVTRVWNATKVKKEKLWLKYKKYNQIMKNMTKVKTRYNTCMYATYTSACVLTRMYIVYYMVYLEKKNYF